MKTTLSEVSFCKQCKAKVATGYPYCQKCMRLTRNILIGIGIVFLVSFGVIYMNWPSHKEISALTNLNWTPNLIQWYWNSWNLELPQEKLCTSDLGIIKMDINGKSIGKKTEMTELRRLINKVDCERIEITYVWRGSKYDDMPKKIVYSKRDAELKDIYTRTNVIEDYTGVWVAGLKKFLEANEKAFYVLADYTDAKYDFNNREMIQTAVWEKPVQSELDSSVNMVKTYLQGNLKNSSSLRYLEWSKVAQLGEYWIVRCKFSGSNSFGAIITENKWFYIQNGNVIKTKDIN